MATVSGKAPSLPHRASQIQIAVSSGIITHFLHQFSWAFDKAVLSEFGILSGFIHLVRILKFLD
ncbi:hypothetical protein PILCRDRAFT_810794 [Piloderma croceum F 1598]|uniref:Uncharacterized protein n=1 Tax=Piloderma croceum (strain F 1598) TaxID=765440 RepID=A0A0C3CP49_PILCF|nr:hypothetical protein PILCRDRAFT_810794 [Piloderma croceum F 1598]